MNRFERPPQFSFDSPEDEKVPKDTEAEIEQNKSRFWKLGEELSNFKIESPEDADKALDMLSALSDAALQEMDDISQRAGVKARGKILELDIQAMKEIKERQIDIFGSIKKWLGGKQEEAKAPDKDVENAIGEFLSAKNIDEVLSHFTDHPQREKLAQDLTIRSLVATHLGELLVREDDPEKAIVLARTFSIRSWPYDIVSSRIKSNVETAALEFQAHGNEDAARRLKQAFGQEGKKGY